jgi:trimethylamine--corrinoid protein Co-methyltransferase
VARARLSYLSAEERDFIHEQTAFVLENVGIAYNTPAAIDLLEEAGAAVDHERLTARLPWQLVEHCLKTCPREIRLDGRDPATDAVLGDGSLLFCTDGTGTYMYDDITGERSEGTAADMRDVMRLYDALPEVDYAWPSISARDLDPLTSGLEIEAMCLANFTKHLQDEVRDVAHVKPLLEILQAVAGSSLWDRPIFSTIN